ncbi:class II fructose-bisphosphate aldolase [Prauserella cavernicola]|uniref:Class II fructose-bisphosphate aldolase n=1 Tax=Prauserella cavernicola TaxID=2800127 RepID=A0A934QQG3_9PSEU|nr:class II fructose-bisphosphate aldolase [Prauserella cavernicola]MBK1783608.1 class II fructose-bisphosphate aldolase [Prauserella cavernicola]
MRNQLAEARRERRPLGAFTCYTLDTAAGVLDAAESAGAPVVLLVSDAALRAPAGPRLLTALVAMAQRAAVPAWVQLDHCPDLERIRQALDLGAGGVMADGSRLDDAANLEFTREAVALATPYGAAVEAELGRIEGDEDIDVAAAAGAFTDPAAAEDFVRRTGVDCLAVAIGNVHGSYRHEPRLDWQRLADIADRLPVAVSLHGTSGLPADQLRRAHELGAVKFNVNTELRRAHVGELRRALDEAPASTDVLALTERLRATAAETTGRFLRP